MSSANEWLKKYTYEPFDKYPDESIIKQLIKLYPQDGEQILYRGLNFSTKELYDEFMNNISNGKITTNGISSWSPSKTQAEQFAITKPSYTLSYSTLSSYDEMEKQHENVSGYRGVILVTKASNGIDVNKSKFAKESEVILPAGTYPVKVIQVKKFKDQFADGDRTLESTMKEIVTSYKQKTINDNITQLKRYVLKNYSEEIKHSEKFKEQLFLMAVGFIKKEQTPISISVDKDRFFKDHLPKTDVRIRAKYGLFDLAEQGFIPKKYEGLVVKYANSILSEALKAVNKYKDEENVAFSFRELPYVAKYSTKPELLTKIQKIIMVDKYNKLNSMDATKKINSLSGKDQRKAINNQIEQLKRLFGQFS